MECHADFTKENDRKDFQEAVVFCLFLRFVLFLKTSGRTSITEKAKEVLSGSLHAVAHRALPVPLQPKAFPDLWESGWPQGNGGLSLYILFLRKHSG